MNGELKLSVPAAPSTWRRRNAAERRVRDAIGRRNDLAVFGTGFDLDDDGRPREVFVTLTAADESAKTAAPLLLNGSSGLDDHAWENGWRRLQLGDWMIRVYPERSLG